MPSAALFPALEQIVGTSNVLRDPDDLKPFVTDWRNAFTGRALAVVRPRTTDEVAAVVRIAREAAIAIVPQGGNTGLAAGATPLALDRAIVLNLAKLDRIRSVDAAGNTIAVETGVVLTRVQEAADAAGRLFPLSLAAEGSAQIGGLISTNAGGSGVLRYGTMRALVLGLEVVLADGSIADGMRALRKDNAGYDWKQLFIGAEGTLGVVTAAVLRLFPKPRERATALFATSSPDAALAAFSRLQELLGETLTASELVPDAAVALRIEQSPSALVFPMQRAPWYLLIEVSASLPGVRDAVEAALADVLEAELAEDCVVAESSAQAAALWEWREGISEAEKRAGPSAKHDVCVAISAVPAFIAGATAAVEAAHPGARALPFGHVGDGNVHFNVLLPPDGSATAHAVNATVHAIVKRHRGSITAEHGIGRYRRDELPEHRSSAELALMRAVKRALDPDGIMNPGAVLPG